MPRETIIRYSEGYVSGTPMDTPDWFVEHGFELLDNGKTLLKQNPTHEDIKHLLERMDVREGSGFTIFLPDEQDKGKNILAESAEQNRVYVAFRKGRGEIFIKDPKMEDNHEEVKLADPALEPIPIIQTLAKDDALHVIMHILEHDDVPDPFRVRWPDERSDTDD